MVRLRIVKPGEMAQARIEEPEEAGSDLDRLQVEVRGMLSGAESVLNISNHTLRVIRARFTPPKSKDDMEVLRLLDQLEERG